MSPWLIYFLGVFTLPVLAGLWFTIAAAANREGDDECPNCGKTMGTEGRTPAIVAGIRWRAHYLRYWYRTRPEYTCVPQGNQ